jgi:hypothetical protein
LDASLSSRIEELGMRVLVTDTIMESPADKQALAEKVLKAVGR